MKPSPVASILLFAGTLFLVIGLLGRSWFVHESDRVSQHVGPVWGEVCFDSSFDDSAGETKCETFHFLKDLDKGSWGGTRLMFFLFVLMGLTAMVMTPIAGILLLKNQKSAMSLMTLIFAGGALFLVLAVILYELADAPKGFELPGYGFFIYILGSILAVVGAIMGMARAKGMPAGQLPRPYPQQGYPPQPYPPQQYGSQPYQQPQQPAQPAQSPYAPGVQAQTPYNPQPQAQQGPAHPVCGTPMTWAAQYNRWFCPRCNQYG